MRAILLAAFACLLVLAPAHLASVAAGDDGYEPFVDRLRLYAAGAHPLHGRAIVVNGTIDFLVGYGNLTVTDVESGDERIFNWTRVTTVPYYPPALSPAAKVERVHYVGAGFRLDGRWAHVESPGTFGLTYAERAGPVELSGAIGGRTTYLEGVAIREWN